MAEHTSPESAWLSLNGVVYDVSVYLHYHPGGDLILKGAGKDATNLFSNYEVNLDQYHPWVNAKHLLQNFAIGYLSNYWWSLYCFVCIIMAAWDISILKIYCKE